ncbi:unnamed protein product [Prorocentrum cordatum]|uniref:Uncharacterized protein n=1 Tax=Prorocentrum cordatum TaxID=2364126 RepID=A0ABN9SAT6_9DINO|nr:unnamed protein product [Polarella glacialis]
MPARVPAASPEFFLHCSPRGNSAGNSDSSGGSSWELVELESSDDWQVPDLPPSALQSADETARFGCWPFGPQVRSLVSLVSDPIVEQDSADEPEGLEIQMPVEPWSRRFYRLSATDGVEVQLVRRKSGNVWAVIGPDLTLGLICITAKTSIFTDPVAGIRWRPMPPLSAAQRDAYVSQATEGLRASTAPMLPLYRPGRGGQQAMAVNVLYAVFSSGASALKTLRWSLRSPKRFLGVLAALFVLYNLLVLLGVIEYMKEVWVYTISYLATAKDAFVETSEVVQEWATYLWEWKEWAQKLMPLQRWFAMFLALILLTLWAAHEWSDSGEHGESSIGSSSASRMDVPVGSTASVPPPLPPPGYLSSGESAALASQLNDLVEPQKAMMEEISEIRTAERTRELRRDVLEASLDSRGRSDAEANKQVIEGMIARLDRFEARLKGEAVELAIKRMRFKAQLPQQVFMEQLDEYKEIEPEEWNSRMPEGYRQRISAEVLSEIYSSGKTAEAWARGFIRDRGLSDCNTAREMIAAFAAVDTMLMTDRQRGLLNLVSFERLVRKGYAIVRAYRNVNSRDDWSRPKDAKNWKSKVDWEAARRLDPQLADESTIRAMSAQEEMKKAMGRDAQLMKARPDLDGGAVVLFARPERPASTSRRVLSRWKEEMELVETANRSLLALRQLYRGSLDDSLLGLADCWGQGIAPDNLDGDLTRRVLGEVRRQSPPSTTPSQGAALLRLRPAATAAGNQFQSTFKQRVAELRRRSAGGSGRLPDRGETFPAQWDRVALPPPGTRPASARSASPRAAQKLEMFKEEMLREDGEACVQACEIRNYVDPHFRKKKEMLQLARRMVLAGMLRRTAVKVDEVGLFCAAKKAELVGSEPEVTLSLVFDQRRSNMRWRSPPRRAMGGASAMSFLDVSEEMKEDGVTMRFGTGDLPDFYYTLELGEELAPYFALPGVSGDALDALLPEGSSLPGSGPYVGVQVALMGFSWACWMAQTTMEDIFNTGPQFGLPSHSDGQRLAEGGPLPHLSRDLPAAHYEYIDDFGIMGLDFPTRPGQEAATTVEEIWLGAKELVVSAGFKGHKILIHKWELPDTVARIVGILSWGFLICRCALSVFADVHSWRMEFRGGARREAPREVLRELAAAAALALLISVDLSTPWGPMVMMFDASLYGGALISAAATVEEQRREARYAIRGGWTVWTGISSSWAAGARCEGEAFRRVGTDVELGTRIRVPPVHERWDDIARWKEVARWRWEEKEHINLLEMRTGLAAARRMAALDLGRGMREHWRWAPSDRNHSDGPSRGGFEDRGPGGLGGGGPSPAIPVKVLRFVHLCSGHTRIGDLGDWLLRIAGSRGYLMICTDADIGFEAEFDLTDEVNARRLELLAEVETDGGHSGGDAKKVKLGNAQLLSSSRILKSIGLKGGSVSVEHPADPGCPPFPSIFVTKELMDWEAHLGAYRATSPQCMRGCPALKLTTPTGAAFGVQRFVRPCAHENHSASLCGEDESGRFRTRAAQAYSFHFCRTLAECHVDATLTMQERREADLTERAAEQLISDTMERRRRDATLLESLPAAVQDYADMMQDLRDWAQQWYSDLTQRATDGTEWQEWRVAFMTDVLLSGPNQALRRPLVSGPPRHTITDIIRVLCSSAWRQTQDQRDRFVASFREATPTERQRLQQEHWTELEDLRAMIRVRIGDQAPDHRRSPPPGEPDSSDEQPSAGTACRSSCPRWPALLGWLLLPFLSDAVGEERLRHHAQHRKMGNTHRRNDAEGAHPQRAQRRERATHGLALLPFSVSTKTALGCYVPNVRRFLDFALEVNLPMRSREEIDDSVLCYLDRLVEDKEVGPHRGDFAAHGLAYVWPELSTGLPRSNRALRACHRLHVAGEGGAQPLELWAVLDEAARLAGGVEAADAAEVALDAHLKSAELFALQAADIAVDADEAGEQIAALRLGVTERGERTKTGVRQGALIDRRHVSDMLARRKSERGPSDRVFSCSVDAYRWALRRACDDVGVERFPPHAARHSGPSHDAATDYRTAWAIQRRGRWASEKSVLRYMKTHALVAARAALPPDILERGSRLIQKKSCRPAKARE